MAEFQIPKSKRVNIRTLAKGFGLPLVKQALLKKVIEPTDPSDGTSLFGTPLYGTLFIERPTYTLYEYNEVSKSFQDTSIVLAGDTNKGGVDGLLIEGCLIEVNQQKNIVTTEIMGKSGTVKEYINEGDLIVTVRGFIADKSPGVYPRFKVQLLQKYLQAPVAIKLVNTFINDVFGVGGESANSFVVTDWQMFQQEGTRNIQFFQFTCLSDAANEIIVNNASS